LQNATLQYMDFIYFKLQYKKRIPQLIIKYSPR
jgi:hypothetical protein